MWGATAVGGEVLGRGAVCIVGPRGGKFGAADDEEAGVVGRRRAFIRNATLRLIVISESKVLLASSFHENHRHLEILE